MLKYASMREKLEMYNSRCVGLGRPSGRYVKFRAKTEARNKPLAMFGPSGSHGEADHQSIDASEQSQESVRQGNRRPCSCYCSWAWERTSSSQCDHAIDPCGLAKPEHPHGSIVQCTSQSLTHAYRCERPAQSSTDSKMVKSARLVS